MVEVSNPKFSYNHLATTEESSQASSAQTCQWTALKLWVKLH